MGREASGGRFPALARTTTAGRKPGSTPPVMRLARLLGRQIAREQFRQQEAANDNAPADEAGDG